MKKLSLLIILMLASIAGFSQVTLKEQPWLFYGTEKPNATQFVSSTFVGLKNVKPKLHILIGTTLAPKANLNFLGLLINYPVKIQDAVLTNNLGVTVNKDLTFRSIRIIENLSQGRVAFRVVADKAKNLNTFGIHGFYKPYLNTQKGQFLALSLGINSSLVLGTRKAIPTIGIETLF